MKPTDTKKEYKTSLDIIHVCRHKSHLHYFSIAGRTIIYIKYFVGVPVVCESTMRSVVSGGFDKINQECHRTRYPWTRLLRLRKIISPEKWNKNQSTDKYPYRHGYCSEDIEIRNKIKLRKTTILCHKNSYYIIFKFISAHYYTLSVDERRKNESEAKPQETKNHFSYFIFIQQYFPLVHFILYRPKFL